MAKPVGSPVSLNETRCGQASGRGYVQLDAVHGQLMGKCQSLLVTGSDGHHYALKMLHPGYSSPMLASEALAGLLASRLHLPVADWCPMIVGDEVSRWNPAFRFCGTAGPVAPESGIFYASRIAKGKNGERPYELVPRAWHDRIENRRDFVGMAIFDLWSFSAHHRQAVFLPNGGQLRVLFFDHCHAFGGPEQRPLMLPEDVLYFDRDVYGDLWKDEALIRGWLDAIRSVSIHEVHAHIDTLPPSWVTESWRYSTTLMLEASQRKLEKHAKRLAMTFQLRHGQDLDVERLQIRRLMAWCIGDVDLGDWVRA
jgi:hypothetical protein